MLTLFCAVKRLLDYWTMGQVNGIVHDFLLTFSMYDYRFVAANAANRLAPENTFHR